MSQLSGAIVNLEKNKALDIAEEKIDSGEELSQIISGIREAEEIATKRFVKGNFFIAELVKLAEIRQQLFELLKPELTGEVDKRGRILFGSLGEDLHSICKNFRDTTIALLRAYGFMVKDLGSSASPGEIADSLKKNQFDIVGMNALSDSGFESMKDTVDLIEKEKLRKEVIIIIGGKKTDEKTKRHVKADHYAREPINYLKIAKNIR